MSKGSTRRPAQIPDAQLEDNWQRIFGGMEKASCQSCEGIGCQVCWGEGWVWKEGA